MKTITLTDDQFDTLFDRIDKIVQTIVDASVEYQDSEMLEEWEDLLDVHTVLEEVNGNYQTTQRHTYRMTNLFHSMFLRKVS